MGADGNSSVTLPKGGGAISGLGEKFSPDLFTGTGNFTVPITLPPGRNGFQPELSLGYSTGNGNGPFGLGWALSIPGITRKTSKGIPKYQGEDTFILSGAEDLVPIKIIGNVTRYKPRTEGLFARIERHRDVDNDYWKVWSKDGLISYYGTPKPEDAQIDWRDPAIISDPKNKEKIFSWKITKTVDPFGNSIQYSYLRDFDNSYCQIYPEEIKYVDYGENEVNDESKFLITIRFKYDDIPHHYEDHIDDNRHIYPISDYRAGFEIRTSKRCNAIGVYTNPDGLPELTSDQKVRSYNFVYLDQLEVEELSKLNASLPVNGVSLLHQIEVTGYNGSETETMPAPRFGYSQFNPEMREFEAVAGRDLPTQSMANPNLELIDLFGNGLPDLLETQGTVRYWRNLGHGTFDMPREMQNAPTGINLADRGVRIIDADGDGRPDLLVMKEGLSGFFPTQPEGLWDRRSFQRYRQTPSFGLEDPQVIMIDLDGDGISDILRSGNRFELFYNDPEEGWNETKRVHRENLDTFPDVNFSDARVKWADMTGDGLTDIVLVHDGNIEYWPNMGHGKWGKRIHMHDSPRFPYGYDPNRIFIGDVNGDGASDLIYIDNHEVILLLNQAGRGWSDPITYDGTPPVTDPSAIRLVDLHGSGVSGLLWTRNKTSARDHYFFLDFTGGVKPYLLNEMDNRLGAVTRVKYEPSTRFYLEDEKDPTTRWQTTLPFPVQVVSRVEVIDQISKGKLTTEYSYHNGYWDGEEREFRGFGRVDQRDSESFEAYHHEGIHETQEFLNVDEKLFSHPTETRTWFYQGAIMKKDGDWISSDYRGEYWQEDQSKLTWLDKLGDFLKSQEPRHRRDAMRTLRGRVLRSELYALDGSELEKRPYTVSKSIYSVREESPPSDNTASQKIFFPYQVASQTNQWERGTDPMTQFSFTGSYDQYGQPTERLQIACPKGWENLNSTSQDYLSTYSKTAFAQRNEEDKYIVDRVAETKSFEIKSNTDVTVKDLWDEVQNGTASKKLIAHKLNFYDGEPFTGRELGAIGDYGALSRSESLVLTENILQKIHGDNLPPYFNTDGTPEWSDEYPQEFVNNLPVQSTADITRPNLMTTPLGYGYSDGTTDPYEQGYYVASQRQEISQRGLPKITMDPLGNQTKMEYDSYNLFPTHVIDAVNLQTIAEYNYRVMKASMITDPNENRSVVRYSPLGLVKSVQLMARDVEQKGDREDYPGTWFEYDFFAFENSPEDNPQPIYVHSIQRTEHAWELIKEENERRSENVESAMTESEIKDFLDTYTEEHPERFIKTREYSDGFGRLIQTRAQAEDVLFGDELFGNGTLPEDQKDNLGTREPVLGRKVDELVNVRVNGWQTFDNKGQPVEQYEPFYHTGWDYLDRSEAADDMTGQKVTKFYDPRGQVVRTVNPDDSEQRVIYGVPNNLSNPDDFEPTPWQAFTYDTNDNAGRTHPNESGGYQHHWNTPASITVDALGRTIEAVERTREESETSITEITTISRYDIFGNLLEVTDALDRRAFQYSYSLIPETEPLRIDSIDAGLRQIVVDALGQEIERRDGKGSLILQNYDEVLRPTHFWARDDEEDEVKLRQKLIYGDSSDANLTLDEIEAGNFLGQLYQHYDEAGRVTVGGYDFKGNLLEATRQVIADEKLLSVYEEAASNNWEVEPFQVDWRQPVDSSLNSTRYTTTTTYDALNRATSVTYPEDVEGIRSLLVPSYNRAGILKSVILDDKPYVERIAYNAKGQRTLIAYGNKRMTRYTYDDKTFRLKRLKTEKFSQPDPLNYIPDGAPLQDFGYDYDLAGNILKIKDRTPGSGSPATPNQLDRIFKYDPLYRLRSATGRECDHAPPNPPWIDEPQCQDQTRTRAYSRTYDYDRMGNVQTLHHDAAGPGNSFNRNFEVETDSNRLMAVTFAGTSFDYVYDKNGNLEREGESRHFEWNYSDQLKAFRTQTEGSEPSVHAQYLYDAAGQRVMKLVRKQGGKQEARVYIGELFEHYRWGIQSNNPSENNILQVMDDQQRIALVRRGQAHPDDRIPDFQFHLGDHLGSSNLILGVNGNFINREEYYPFGETAFGSFGKKRYRFTSKERDEESGLSYYGARYYGTWMQRWINCDPIGMSAGLNLFMFVRDNPLVFVDLNGLQEQTNDNQTNLDPTSPILEEDDFNSISEGLKKVRERENSALERGVDQKDSRLNFIIYLEEEAEEATGENDHIEDYEIEGYIKIGVENFDEVPVEIVNHLEENPNAKIGEIIIATHGSSEGLTFPTRSSIEAQYSGHLDEAQLKTIILDLPRTKRNKLHDSTDRNTIINLHSCKTGNNPEFMKAMGGFFGGNSLTVKAAKKNVKFSTSNGKLSQKLEYEEGKYTDIESKKSEKYKIQIRVNRALKPATKEAPLKDKKEVIVPRQ